LGHAAGSDLGDEVNKEAIKTKQKYVTQKVSNPMYEGEVFCYTKEFLNSFFKIKEEIDNLPF
jgi:hypothetical protein